MMQTKFFHPKKGHWKLEVSGEPTDAHIKAYGVVPRDIKISVTRKEESGYRNTFVSLEYLAEILTKGR